ncbi:MAG: helix-turn-helix transcriptional regulator [Bacteroidales bacterium]|nr:helix-turn-helix transcriptional regulator [Bacteroidales bacterium]
MNEQIRQIAERLRGMRDALDMSISEMAEACQIKEAEYESYESGQVDIPMSFICRFADYFKIQPSELLSGEQAYMSHYFLTRKDKGLSVERQKAYKYQALAMGFKNAKADPFIVTVEPNDTPKEELHLNSHPDQEFNMVLEGSLLLIIDGKELILNEGDSIYFDSTRPHAMKALNGKAVKFFAIIL